MLQNERTAREPSGKAPSRRQVLYFYNRALSRLTEESKLDPELNDEAIWTKHIAELLRPVIDDFDPGPERDQPSEVHTAEERFTFSRQPVLPPGREFPVVLKRYPIPDDSGELVGFYFGLYLDSVLGSLSRDLAGETDLTKAKGIRHRIKILKAHSFNGGNLVPTGDHLAIARTGIVHELEQLSPGTEEPVRLANAQKFATGSMLILPFH